MIDRLPPNTCPLIDSVLERIDQALGELQKISRDIGHEEIDVENIDGFVSDAVHELKSCASTMEDIRSANAKLRDAAETNYSEGSDYRDQVEDLEGQVRDLKDEVETLQHELNQVET